VGKPLRTKEYVRVGGRGGNPPLQFSWSKKLVKGGKGWELSLAYTALPTSRNRRLENRKWAKENKNPSQEGKKEIKEG